MNHIDDAEESTTLRVAYWPNENADPQHEFRQFGGRAAFEALAADGRIALDIFSYRPARTVAGSFAAFEAQAIARLTEFKPDILFVQHVWGTDLPEELWRRIRNALPNLTIAYHEGDPFDRRIKRIDDTTIGILRHTDIILACGLGSLADILGEHSTAPVGYLPHAFVKSRFAKLDPAKAVKTADIVMIGNRGRRRRMKWAYVPGGRRRAQLATRLSEVFGTRFALYGDGWSHLPSARGLLPFFQQEEAIQSGRITANWDHFDTIDYYFSDRLPITLAAGVPHVTTYHVGYDHLFAGVPGLYACKTVEEAVETCRWLLSRPDADLLAEGLAAKEWVFANMEANILFKRGLDQAIAVRQAAATVPAAP